MNCLINPFKLHLDWMFCLELILFDDLFQKNSGLNLRQILPNTTSLSCAKRYECVCREAFTLHPSLRFKLKWVFKDLSVVMNDDRQNIYSRTFGNLQTTGFHVFTCHSDEKFDCRSIDSQRLLVNRIDPFHLFEFLNFRVLFPFKLLILFFNFLQVKRIFTQVMKDQVD